jgi:hypothetical protein
MSGLMTHSTRGGNHIALVMDSSDGRVTAYRMDVLQNMVPFPEDGTRWISSPTLEVGVA